MRPLLAVVAFLCLAAPAHAANVDARPRLYSPDHGRLAITGSLPHGAKVGVELATADGRQLGWIAAPKHRSSVDVAWNGRLNGRRIGEGRYVVRLVSAGKTLASTRFRVDRTAPELLGLRVGNGGSPYAGDGPLLTTISPNGDGFRDGATIHFRLTEPATVTLQIARTVTTPRVFYELRQRFGRGAQSISWFPKAPLNPRTYVTLLTAVDAAGNTSEYGPKTGFVSRYARSPVIRLQGIDAGFTRPGYAPGALARLRIGTDAPELTLRVFQSGPEQVVTYADNQMAGVEVPDREPVVLDWSSHGGRPVTIDFRVGDWPSGLYYVELKSEDGRVGYAPFVVRPAVLGAKSRIAVILPTNTWQAYNFWDENGDGYGDTWYAGGANYRVDLSRPYIHKGALPRFYRYDLPFLHWLYWSGKTVDFLSDDDLASLRTGDDLAAGYDLIVFEGHEEYVSQHVYDIVRRYRDLGGNLMFLSANNFFWRVARTGTELRKTGQFRQVDVPEASLLGVQYRANDNGQRQGNFVVRNAAVAPWLWQGTDMKDGSTFGDYVGGYGIEIDATAPFSPPATLVVAEIPDLFGPGLTAEMTYYETSGGAKVFAAGALDFGGSATFAPVSRMLQNLWDRLSVP